MINIETARPASGIEIGEAEASDQAGQSAELPGAEAEFDEDVRDKDVDFALAPEKLATAADDEVQDELAKRRALASPPLPRRNAG